MFNIFKSNKYNRLPEPQNPIPIPKHELLLEKEVKYKDKYWFVRIIDSSIEVYHSKEKHKVIGNHIFESVLHSTDLIEATEKAVEEAYKIAFPIDKYEYFKKWDGNVDNKLPKIQP